MMHKWLCVGWDKAPACPIGVLFTYEFINNFGGRMSKMKEYSRFSYIQLVAIHPSPPSLGENSRGGCLQKPNIPQLALVKIP